MKLPAFFPPALRQKKKLRATAAARRSGVADADFEEMSEPNMKLSRALLIVLVLHIVAVAGIIAFNAIKSRHGPIAEEAPKSAVEKSTPDQGAAVAPVAMKKPAATPAKPEKKLKATETSESGKSYTVVKGDTPVTIAKKFKITTDDLLTANKIDDPHKLKIGQKLMVPAKKKKN